MHKVIIKKTGLFFSFWNEESANWIEKNIIESSLPITWYLSYPIQFEEVLTVREMIGLLEPYSELLSIVMIRDLAGIDIREIFEVSKKVKEKPSQIAPTSAFLIKIADSIPTVSGEEETNFINWYPVLVGIEQIDETGEEDTAHSLSSIDFLDWCDLLLEVDDYIEFLNPETEESQFEGIMNWTLQEILTALLGQVSTTLQVNQTSIAKSNPEEGPLQMEAIFDWIDDLDRIFLK
jgi:hypothetical protein